MALRKWLHKKSFTKRELEPLISSAHLLGCVAGKNFWSFCPFCITMSD